MTTWNYRVINRDDTFAIYEAYYDDAGNVISITAEPVAPLGESLAELRADLEHYRKALDEPVLRYEDVAGDETETPEDWDDQLLDAVWVSLVEQTIDAFIEANPPDGNGVTTLPPRLRSAVLAAAENLAHIAADEDIRLGGARGEATPQLRTLLDTIQDGCVSAEQEPRPYLGDALITPQEIAAVLETVALLLQSDETYEFAGRNPGWFSDAARVVEWLEQQLAD